MSRLIDDKTGAAWLRQQAVSWRSRGLRCYRAHEDEKAMRLLDMADEAWRVIADMQADAKPKQEGASA